jgi:hypothetical protein
LDGAGAKYATILAWFATQDRSDPARDGFTDTETNHARRPGGFGSDSLAIEPDSRTGEAAAVPGASRLAGYFVVQAEDRRAAAEIARTCPHVRYGGRIVIREIGPT